MILPISYEIFINVIEKVCDCFSIHCVWALFEYLAGADLPTS